MSLYGNQIWGQRILFAHAVMLYSQHLLSTHSLGSSMCIKGQACIFKTALIFRLMGDTSAEPLNIWKPLNMTEPKHSTHLHFFSSAQSPRHIKILTPQPEGQLLTRQKNRSLLHLIYCSCEPTNLPAILSVSCNGFLTVGVLNLLETAAHSRWGQGRKRVKPNYPYGKWDEM